MVFDALLLNPGSYYTFKAYIQPLQTTREQSDADTHSLCIGLAKQRIISDN